MLLQRRNNTKLIQISKKESFLIDYTKFSPQNPSLQMNLERGVKVGITLKPGTFPKHISRLRKGGNRVSNAVHKGGRTARTAARTV